MSSSSSSSSSALSVASTKVNSKVNSKVNGHLKSPNPSQTQRRSRKRKALAAVATSASAQDILLFLVAFRILNALTTRTFFQPDEYFQSLEPAWHMVFGRDSGAWITWEWRHALRSAIHPTIFATVYYLADRVAEGLQLTPTARADLFLAAPKALSGVIAACGDFYTWRLAQRVYGHNGDEAWAALAVTVLSPWQWFCSTRTLSNCLETTLTIAALCNWPWQWSLTGRDHARYDDAGLRRRREGEGGGESGQGAADETTSLRRSLLLAALATILRPTNLLIWVSLAAMTCLKMSRQAWLARLPMTERSIMVDFTSPSFLRATRRERIKLVVETVVCGSAVLTLSLLLDRLYYQFWAFPPLKFIYYNLVQSLAVFYGRNDWHYYLSQGLPLLLTTALPFALDGIYQGFFSSHATTTSPLTATIRSELATISCLVPAILSLIAHKEVRFIYPLLPLLHVLSAAPLAQFFGPSLSQPLRSRLSPSKALLRRLLLVVLILVNLSIGIYTTSIHNRGVIDVLTYLRHQHETHYLQASDPSTDTSPRNPHANLTAAFLMPCHSTPWRSHLVHPGISAWALTCEPPVNLSAAEKKSYVDEADAFYADPLLWMRSNMSRQPPRSRLGRGVGGAQSLDSRGRRRLDVVGHVDSRRAWPDYLVFFAQAEQVMQMALRGSGYGQCWRGFNSHWHDDWRRRGDVVVWCLDPEKLGLITRRAVVRGSSKSNDGKTATGWWDRFSGRKTRTGGSAPPARPPDDGREREQRGRQERSKTTKAVAAVVTTPRRNPDKRRERERERESDKVLGGAKGPWGIGKSRPDPSPSLAVRSRWWDMVPMWRGGSSHGGDQRKESRGLAETKVKKGKGREKEKMTTTTTATTKTRRKEGSWS